jgi:hypothetical protein
MERLPREGSPHFKIKGGIYDAKSLCLDRYSAPVALPLDPASTPEFFEQLPPAPRGTQDNSRKSDLLAWYAAADRLRSEPHMTATPSVVETNQLHARPRLRTVVSKTRN